jgi:DNA polymerase epsilon subunit 2
MLNSSINESSITPIKNLNGKPPGSYLLFGMLTQMKEGLVFLEDLDSSIELILAKNTLMKGPGMFTCNSFVLVHGDYTDDKKFFVQVIGMPPPEPRKKSKQAYGNDVDFFGSPDSISDEGRLLEIEAKLSDSFFVILSDVWLDSARVLSKLEELFKGFSLEDSVLPLAFIFNGNFISKPYTFDSDDYQKYKDGFQQLADLMGSYPKISSYSHFIFVPGPFDPWCGSILPRPRIPKDLSSILSDRFDNIHFASNPARIKFCTKEIVVFREDLMNTLRRNCIIPPLESDEYPLEKQVKLIV